MNNEKTQKEKFENAANKACNKEKPYDFFKITQESSNGILNHCQLSKIRNAIVLFQQSKQIEEWIINDFVIQKCPKALYVCIKNLKNLLGCAGNIEDETSFFELKITKEEIPDTAKETASSIIFGIVDTYNCVIIFYYNQKTMESWYSNSPAIGDDDNTIFKLFEGFQYMEGLLNEQKRKNTSESGQKETLPANIYQWQ